MNKSDSIKELATALAKAQGEIENASKGSVNPHFKSKYADLAEVLNTLRPVFSKHGLSLSQFPSFEGGIASVETILMHSSGEWLSSVASAPVSKQDAQGVGSATTYLRRYSLAAVAGIAQEDDDANSSIGGKPQQVTPEGAPVLSDKDYADLCTKYRASIDAIKVAFAESDFSSAKEYWRELGEEVQMKLWKAPSKGGCFTTEERNKFKSTEYQQAE